MPSLPLGSYVGDYTNRAFGTFSVVLNDTQLGLQWKGNNIGQLRHLQYDSFEYIPSNSMGLETARIDFLVDAVNGVQGLTFPILGYFERVKQ